MALPSTPPLVPERSHYQSRRISAPGSSSNLRVAETPSNRVHLEPATPEVISSLITSLSIISSPANRLFEESSVSARNSPNATQTNFDNPLNRFLRTGSSGLNQSSGGSFGIDYGAFQQSSHDYATDDLPVDEMSASAPVIRTSKPPSGFSPLTAPKPTKEQTASSLKSLLGRSRPTSRESSVHDTESIGSISLDPNGTKYGELRHRSSSETTSSWEKKQLRATKGLMYMSSKERLRDTERKRAAASSLRSPGSDRLPKPEFDKRSFMSEIPITEEPGAGDFDGPAPSPGIGPPSPMHGSFSNGGIGSGRYIPARDSSLKTRKHNSGTSRRSSRQPGDRAESTIKEADESAVSASEWIEKRRSGVPPEEIVPAPPRASLREPLPSPIQSVEEKTTRHKDLGVHLGDESLSKRDEVAPHPVVPQGKSRDMADEKVKAKKSGGITPDPFERLVHRDSKRKSDPKRNSRNSKRLAGHISSGAESDTEPSRPVRKEHPELKNPRASGENPPRPSSADSIDDAVDAYLSSPRLSHKIKHPQTGRIISFSEVGDPTGFAVFCCVGMGLTRYITAFYDELALTLKLRLITPDRPGVGDSEPYPDGNSTPLSWPDDVYAICQTLKITKFSILAHSAGAIYALATALRMPQHIRGRIHLLAPWIPPSQLNVICGQQTALPANSLPTSQRILRNLPTSMLKIANSSFMSATSSSITSSLPKQRRAKRKSTPGSKDAPARQPRTLTADKEKEHVDLHSEDFPKPNEAQSRAGSRRGTVTNSQQAILAAAALTAESKERQTAYDTRLTHAIWDLATSGANPAVDLLVCLERRHTIGFRYVDITRAVIIHHGSKDTRVPVENVKWLGKMMRRCEVRVLEGEGHGLMASATVMGGVLMEIAGEWEDWVKVVERKGGQDGKEAGRRLRESRSIGAFRGKD